MQRLPLIIAGGGISGLSLALSLLKNTSNNIILIEKQSSVGGWIKTKNINNSYIDTGPRSIRVSGGNITLNILNEIGLNPIPANISSKQRYVYYKSLNNKKPQIHSIPLSILQLFNNRSSIPFWKNMITTQIKQILSSSSFSSSNLQDISVYSFFKDQFGYEFTNKLISSMMVGIYAGDSKYLSFKDCFASLYKILNDTKQSSIIKALLYNKIKNKNTEKTIKTSKNLQSIGMYSFQLGMQQFPNTLLEYLNNTYSDRFKCMKDTEIETINNLDNCIQVCLKNLKDNSSSILDGKHIFSCLPSHILSKLFNNENSNEYNQTRKLLNSIPFCDIAVVNLLWNSNISLNCNGFGYLVSPETSDKILGATFDNKDNPNETRISVMIGGANTLENHYPLISTSDINNIATERIMKHLNISQQPDNIYCNIHKQAIPQYNIGHYKKVQELKELNNHIFLDRNGQSRISFLGNSYEGISINNCIETSTLYGLYYSKLNKH